MGGPARALAMLAAGGFLVVLVGSVVVLVPIQRRLRSNWLRGHLVRTAGALACFALAVVAAVL